MNGNLNAALRERITAKATAKIEEVHRRLKELCLQDQEIGILLKEFEEFFGIILEPTLVPKEEGPVRRSHAQVAINHSPKKKGLSANHSYGELKRLLPPFLAKVGANDKEFAVRDVLVALEEGGVHDFETKWVSLILSKREMKGVKFSRRSAAPGKRFFNLFKLDGNPIEPVGQIKRRKKKKKAR